MLPSRHRGPISATSRDMDSNQPAFPISNAPDSTLPDDNLWPSKYQFELMRLRQRIGRLECTVKDKDDRIVRALDSLNDEMQFWRTYLLDKVGETMGQIRRRVIRLEAATAYLIDKQAHIYPKLEMTKTGKRH